MGDSFQVHVFGDPGIEIMPQCNACMCYNHIKKTMCFECFHFFHLLSNLESRGWVSGHIFMSFGDPGGTFSDFLRVLETGLKCDDFGEVPRRNQG